VASSLGRDSASGEEPVVRRIHKHIEDGWRLVLTDGEGFDCPPERECWVTLGPPDKEEP
jgi:hypothetical protein